jgi:hypothetical protein
MNYFTWSKEYYSDAENLLKTIRKYEEELKKGDSGNFEFLHSTISSYRNIYYDLLNTAKMLESKAMEEQNAA